MKLKCFGKAIKKYGWNNFKHIILVKKTSLTNAKKLERYFINQFDSLSPNGYNLTKGGDGVFGYKHTYKTKKKMSNSHIGKPSNRKGAILSQEIKDKISKAKIGKKMSKATKKVLRKRFLGRKLSEIAKKKLSLAKKRR